MIGIITDPAFDSTGLVVKELKRRKVSFVKLFQGSFPDESRISWSCNSSKDCRAHIVTIDGKAIDLTCLRSIWYWHTKRPAIKAGGSGKKVRSLCAEEWFWFVQGLWRSLNCFWLNAPGDIREADHKVLQIKLASDIGFQIPDTLISNDPSRIGEFWTKHGGRIIRKSLITQSVPYQGSPNVPLYTEAITRRDLRDCSSLCLAPTIYQENLEKKYDLRITVVGDKLYPVEIHSQNSDRSRQDFRKYDFEKTPYLPHELPPRIAERCIIIMRRLRLWYGAIDMILTPDLQYVFLEVNPSGQYGWIEGLTGMPITAAICDLLQNPPKLN